MDVRREEGLKRRIGEDNIGYKLMLKMGFKGDGGIGKKGELFCYRTRTQYVHRFALKCL